MSKLLIGRKMKYGVKPCPCCGSRVWVREIGVDLFDSAKKKYVIACGRCDLTMPKTTNLKGLIARWDRRLPPQAAKVRRKREAEEQINGGTLL